MRVLLLGYGKIGRTIHDMLRATGRYDVTIGESSQQTVQEAAARGLKAILLDVTDTKALASALLNKDIVVNALPHQFVAPVALAAAEHHVHYFDLTEDVATTRHIKRVGDHAQTVLMPQCGLAPGFISIAAYDLIRHFDKVKDVMMRVGALPIYPTNKLKYNLTWSTDGLINEYCMPCESIHNGIPREVLPLEGYELFSLDGVEYECFNTSGGIGTMCETLTGKVDNLSYKTIRYTGHCELAKLLINELGLGQKRDILKEILENSIAMTMQDEVLVFVSVCGWKNGRLVQENFVRKIYGCEVAGEPRSAIQITTAAGICGAIDLFTQGHLPKSGFIRQEQVSLSQFLASPFGKYYMDPTTLVKAA